MRSNKWSGLVVVLGLFSLAVQASPPPAPEPGTRVTVRLAEASGALPDAEKLVESLVSTGGEHRIRVRRQQAPGQTELVLDLWGGTVPREDIAQTLRSAWPVLASADIQVVPLDPSQHPTDELPPPPEGEGEPRGRKVVKKIIQKK